MQTSKASGIGMHPWKPSTWIVCILALMLGGCGLPDYPEDREIKEAFLLEYRDAECQVTQVHAPVEVLINNKTFAYMTVQVDAMCRDHHGDPHPITSNQTWQVHKQPNTLLQGVRRWTRTGG
ncbi:MULTISPECIES: hypothetical protein [unclassified Pseudomonas]|uniref:hypothetical protein n=1 Tax=unclassified Pseudomonas TaxID=196821 RepID=UPI00244D216B|nr:MULTISPECIES: hypothetical protein [unclassified Pseudomonas]MDG9930191.1 hypothetical protein [Pseudomonas sp. GD04042]MDH0485886.1 hypothetical protein [Pseudomonas sp. GD04015]MDH0607119.1 hypothetical protein [Pseudomonas sp. GD03869]